MDIYKSVKISIGTEMKNPEMSKFVPSCYKNQEMCNKAVDYYPNALEFVPECYKTQKMCDKAVNNHASTIQFVPECYKTQEVYYKADNRFFLYLILLLINIKLKKYVMQLFLYILF